jgi:hypothetical protein
LRPCAGRSSLGGRTRAHRPHDQGGRARECPAGQTEPLHQPPERVRRQEHKNRYEGFCRVSAQRADREPHPGWRTAVQVLERHPKQHRRRQQGDTEEHEDGREPRVLHQDRADENDGARRCAGGCDQPAPGEGKDHPERAPPALSGGGHSCCGVAASGLLGSRRATAGRTAGEPGSTAVRWQTSIPRTGDTHQR